jgi:hypothetical protein
MNDGRHRSKLVSSEFGPSFRCLEDRTEDWGQLCLARVTGSRASKLHGEVRINHKSRSRWLKCDRARGRNIPAATRGAKAHANECIVRPSAALASSLERRAFAAVPGCCWVNEGCDARRVYPSGIRAGLLDACAGCWMLGAATPLSWRWDGDATAPSVIRLLRAEYNKKSSSCSESAIL